jgi:hypothetical protein
MVTITGFATLQILYPANVKIFSKLKKKLKKIKNKNYRPFFELHYLSNEIKKGQQKLAMQTVNFSVTSINV